MWKKSYVIPIFKDEWDVKECGNNKEIKFMSQYQYIRGKVIDKRNILLGEPRLCIYFGDQQWDQYFA